MPVFADTFYFLALLNPTDEMHARAVELTTALNSLLTTDWVLTELADGMCRPPDRAVAVQFIEALRRDGEVAVVGCTAEWLQRGWDLYRDRPDKSWSLTDCISFEVMRERRISDAL